jgi:hypothetical protein
MMARPQHDGVCGFCGFAVPAGSDSCRTCGATWRAKITSEARIAMAIALVVLGGMAARLTAYHSAGALVTRPYGRIGPIVEFALFLSVWGILAALAILLVSRLGKEHQWFKRKR